MNSHPSLNLFLHSVQWELFFYQEKPPSPHSQEMCTSYLSLLPWKHIHSIFCRKFTCVCRVGYGCAKHLYSVHIPPLPVHTYKLPTAQNQQFHSLSLLRSSIYVHSSL